MSICFHKSLHDLMSLSVEKLHRRSLYSRVELGRAEWKMGLCLLAWQKRGDFEPMGFSSVTEYAERALQLSGQKMAVFLATARALQYLPLVSDAYCRGEICWSKVRALQSLLTPDTEHLWLKYARMFRSDQVARKVGLCLNAWKRQRALAAALANNPIATPEEVARLLDAPLPPPKGSPIVGTAVTKDGQAPGLPRDALVPPVSTAQVPHRGDQDVRRVPESASEPGASLDVSGGLSSERNGDEGGDSAPPISPKVIRLTIEMTPDQFALLESAQGLLKARAGRRISQGEIVARMAEEVLNNAPSRTRAKHLVVIHTTPGSEQAWYETSRGILAVNPETLRNATTAGPRSRAETGGKPTSSRDAGTEAKLASKFEKPTKGHDSKLSATSARQAIPASILTALRTRSGGRCERCGGRGPLHVHHKDRVSEGGGNSLERLENLCWSCHRGEHKREFEQIPVWRAAKEAALSRSRG